MGRVDWGLAIKVLLIAAAVAWLLFVFAPGTQKSSPDCPATSYPENC